jgi:hypothetical protein
MSYLAMIANVEFSDVVRLWAPMIAGGLLLPDGAVHPDVAAYIDRTAQDLDNGFETRCIAFLRGMPLADRLDWLERRGLTSDDGDDGDDGDD